MYEWEKSIGDVLGKPVADVVGYVCAEYGPDTLVFKVTRIIFVDGTYEDVEGEHDFPYIPNTEEKQIIFEHFHDDE